MSEYLCTGLDEPITPVPLGLAGYPTELSVKVGDEAKKLPVAYLWKDAIKVGQYVMPDTGKRLGVDQKRIDGWIEKFHLMRKSGIEIPTPLDHSRKAESNRGFVLDARREGDTLKLLHQVIGEDAATMALRNRSSLCIETNYTDEKGKNWGDCFTHSAFTPIPVISGLGQFEPVMASRDAPATYFLSRSTAMSPEQLTAARTLLATPDLTEDGAVQALIDFGTKSSTDLTASRTELSRLTTERDSIKVELSRAPKPAAPVDPEILSDRADLASQRIDIAVERGDIPPALADKLRKAVKGDAGPNTFMLSRDASLNARPVEFILSLFDGAKLGVKSGEVSGRQTLSREVPGGQDDAAKQRSDAAAEASEWQKRQLQSRGL